MVLGVCDGDRGGKREKDLNLRWRQTVSPPSSSFNLSNHRPTLLFPLLLSTAPEEERKKINWPPGEQKGQFSPPPFK